MDIKKKELQWKEELLSAFDIQEWSIKIFSNEIYENICQVLTLVKLQINTLNPDKKDDIKKIQQDSDKLLAKAIRDLRSLARVLAPAEIMEKGFAASLADEMTRLNKLDLCNVTLKADGDPIRLEEARELILFSIIQHFIMNILYDKKVREIFLYIRYRITNIHVNISYIEPDNKIAPIQKIQRSGMYSRARIISGAIKVKKGITAKQIIVSIKK